MAAKSGSSSFSCVASSLPAPIRSRRSSQLSLSQGSYVNRLHNVQQLRYAKVKPCQFSHRIVQLKGNISKRQYVVFAISEDSSPFTEDEANVSEENDDPYTEDISTVILSKNISTVSTSSSHHEESGGKPGLVSFYNRPHKKEDEILAPAIKRNENNLLWFIGPAMLVASFIFPSLYLRKLISTVFEDSLLTDFLILFFTEALFYCGVAVYLLLIDRLRRPVKALFTANSSRTPAPELGDRISSVTVLVLSLIVPMVTMGLVWPWTGPAASATLAPYLVGIVVQFAFEQYARYIKSPSWPAIPIIFQIYRLHQLNRAAQLVTALSFTVRGAEITSHNVAINSSLGTLLNVLQFLGVICIWSLSSFIMRFFPSSAMIEQ